MSKYPTIFSQRLLRKGPLVEETYRLFAAWAFDRSADDNLAGLHGSFRTQGWEREVMKTINRRLKNFRRLEPLLWLARNGMPLTDWRDCWRLWIGATEEPFRSFVKRWLYDEYLSGRYNLRSEDVREFVGQAWLKHAAERAVLSDYGNLRAARDLLKTSSDLGLLTGRGPTKTFASLQMSDDVLIFYIHLIASIEGSYVKVPNSSCWRLAMLSPDEVHQALLRLHQYRKLDYQIAGSFVQLTLPQSSPLDYAKAYTA